MKNRIALVLLVSGFFGFCLGLFHAQYQWVVESAQILAGIVELPRHNPFYILSVKAWTILNQISALFLFLGVSETVLSFFLSGLAGMISFQALAVSILVLSKNVLFAIVSPFCIFFIHSVFFKGITYPIILLGTDQTYGMIGLSLFLLVTGLIAAGEYKLGALLLGLAPAIHPSQGLWCNLVVFICLLSDFGYYKDILKKFFKYFLIGCFISTFSLAYHFLVTYDVPKVDPAVLSQYYRALMLYWNNHFFKFSLFTSEMMRVTLSLILSLWGLLFLKRILSRQSVFLLYSFIVSALIASTFSFVYWLPPEKISSFYSLLMIHPARLLNYNILGSALLLLGFLGRFKNDILPAPTDVGAVGCRSVATSLPTLRRHIRLQENKLLVQLNLVILVIILTLYRFFYHCNWFPIRIDDFILGVMFISSLGLFLSLLPPKSDFKNLLEVKNTGIMLHLVCVVMMAFYCFYSFFHRISAEILIGIIVFSLGLVLSVNILSQYKEKSNYRLMFILEGLFLVIYGFLWLITNSQNPVTLEKYRLIRPFAAFYIQIIGVLILLFSDFQLQIIRINARDLLHRLQGEVPRPFGLGASRRPSEARAAQPRMKTPRRESSLFKSIFTSLLKGMVVFAFSLTIFLTFREAYYTWQENMKTYFLDWTNDLLYAEIHKRNGIIAAGAEAGDWLMLRTRRPVLHNGGPLVLNYAPEAGPELNQIFQEVYGIDYLNPPKEIATSGLNLPPERVKILWEQRSLEQWRSIKEEFDVIDVLTVVDWELKLPEIMANDKFILYTIPD